ncbi:glycoside hydrolase [Duganella sp. Leaf61]|uniref:GH39 family glycosyl hydrolase n=1 Tax=Duganella sp. Leaf61 TaxID=1736227 RepID=UPI0006FF2D84|nr:glycoside hydrolase [Duganella sp. Leaf61]KQN79031.1 glycoside hydrolase [Duganella sp. Leaf61]
MQTKKIAQLTLLAAAVLAPAYTLAQDRVIDVNVKQVAGPLPATFNFAVGAGRANEGLRADWQQQLAEIKRDAGFKYIRMHGLLTDDMGVYRIDAQGKEHYNFQYIDALYDYLLSIKVKPFVELGFMPSQMASGDKTIFWWRGNVTPPKSYEAWERLVKALTAHWTERYGADEVASWYFEVWNEPNLDGFWAGTQDEYFKLYAHAARAIKSVDARYRVGGPATAGAAWIPETIAYADKNKVPLDFVSTHTYGVGQGFLDEYGTTGTVLLKDDGGISNDVLRNRQEIGASAMPKLELHYTEWSSSYTPSDPSHDSYHQAAYILQKLKQVGTAAQSMSYWVFTDIFEEAGPRIEAFHGGFGLMNTQGIKKPAYFAYQFLNQLAPNELKNTDARSYATADARGNAQVLLWDYTYTLPEKINNQQYFVQDLPARDKGKVAVNVGGLKPGAYTLTVSQVGYQRNDAYTGYIKMGSPKQLTRPQVTTLKAMATGKPSEQKTVRVGADGRFSTSLPLRENDVYLLDLQQAKR